MRGVGVGIGMRITGGGLATDGAGGASAAFAREAIQATAAKTLMVVDGFIYFIEDSIESIGYFARWCGPAKS